MKAEELKLCPFCESPMIVFEDENGKINGVFGVWDLEDVRFVEHFAVSPTLRGGGLGQDGRAGGAHRAARARGLPD